MNQRPPVLSAMLPLLRLLLCSFMIWPAWSLLPANRVSNVRIFRTLQHTESILCSINGKHNDHESQSAPMVTSTTTSQHDPPSSFMFSVAFDDDNRSVDIPVIPGESILTALERAAAQGLTTLTGVPSDCRRGNCLTCSAKHLPTSHQPHLRAVDDDDKNNTNNGLSPHVSHEITKRGYILTCSSTVTGPGVQLRLGTNHDLWDFVYKERFETDEAQATARSAMAKAIRMSAEQNVDEWAEQTEKAYKESKEE